jgi:hypothetical protein
VILLGIEDMLQAHFAKFDAVNLIKFANIEERVAQLFANQNTTDADPSVSLCDSFVHMEQVVAQFFNNDLQTHSSSLGLTTVRG